jgi:tetratricopeptide (TPR) repeat protein/serine/threonine protein kinase
MNERDLFMAALPIADAAERSAYLDRACAGDAALRQRVEALLAASAQAGSFLQQPAADLRATTDVSHPGPATGSDPVAGPGTIIGPYKLLEPIGEGGMGTVWMAQQTEPVKRLVALKLIKAGMDSRQVIARFEAERQALALMDHANIARVLDGGQTPPAYAGGSPRPFFVMDLVKGVPITKYCDDHRLTPRQRLELFVPVCQAVQHAHQKGIIHRDLKPSNVLVALYDGKPVPKVIDFGVAKAAGQSLTDKTLVTGFGAIVGTLEYMSPEQAEINQLDIDTRSDIYSLGVLLYELLTGSPPFTKKELENAGMLEMLRVIREQEPSKPSTKLSTAEGLPTLAANRGTEPAKLMRLVRGELDWIVMKALEKDRNRRYETANGFAMDVQRYLADEPVLACPPSAWYRFGKFARRNRAAALTMAAVLAVMVVAGAGIWSWQHQQGLRRVETDFHTELRRRSVTSSLEQLPELHSRALWTQAEVLLDQADKQLGLDGDGALRERLGQARSNTALLKRLDEIRLERSVIVEGKLNIAGALAAYPKAFLENGFDVFHGDPDEVAAKLNASVVRDYLLAALDDWAMAEGTMAEGLDNRQWIMNLTAAATGQAWRSQLNTFWKDGMRLGEFHDAIPEKERTPAIINMVGRTLYQLGLDGIRRMEMGLRQYPGDFWMHFDFGIMQPKERADVAIGAYRAALAIRPGSSAVRNNLACVLLEKKEYEAASAEFKEAIRLDRKYAAPHSNLGNLLVNQKDYAAATVEYKEAIRLDPNLGAPHNGLGNLLFHKKEYDAASVEYKEAIRLDPTVATPHYGLGNLLFHQKDYDGARVQYKEAIRLDPNDAAAHGGLGNVLYQRKEPAAASAAYKEAIRLDPNAAAAHGGLGNVLYDKKEYEAASAEFKEAIRLDPNAAQPHQGLGNVHYDKKDYDAAMGEYKEAIRLNPTDASAHNNLGNVHRDKKEYAAASAAYQEAIRLDPKLAGPHYGLGNMHREKKEYAAATAAYQEAIRLDPTWAKPHNGLGNVLGEKKAYAAATAEFKEAIRLDPNLAEPHHGLGNVLSEKKEYAAASAEFKEAIRLDPNLAAPHYGLGGALCQMHEYTAAMGEFKEAIRLDPKYAEPHNGLGNVLSHRKEHAAASAAYKEAIRLDPKLAGPHYGLGRVLYDKKEYEAASAAFKEAIRLDPTWAKPHNGLGAVLYHMKAYTAAMGEYHEAIRLDPTDAEPHNNLGNLLYDKKEYAAASAEFKEAIRLDPKNAQSHDNLGNVLRDTKEYDAAITEFKEAIRLDPTDASPHNNLGNMHHDKKEYAAASAAFKEAIRLDPKNAALHYNLGNVHRDKKEYAAASAAYQEAIRLDPNLAAPHNDLGGILRDRKEYDAAIREFKEAIRLDPGFAFPYANLGMTYGQLGRFSEAKSAFEQAAKLMQKDARIQDALRLCTQLLALDQQLGAIRQGSAKPKTPADAAGLAQFASEFKKEYGLAVRLYADAFAADAKIMAAHRYNAACAACLAAAGEGKDADKLDGKERDELRRKALDWLRADLEANRALLEKDANNAGPHVIGQTRHWLADPDLANVREPEALAKLSEAERQAWQMLWTNVAETLKRAQEKVKK